MGWLFATAPYRSLGHDFQPGLFGGGSVVFPANEATNALTLFHAGALVNPMVRLGASPIAATVEGYNASGPNYVTFIGATPPPFLGENTAGIFNFLVSESAENAIASNDAFVFAEGADGKYRVAA